MTPSIPRVIARTGLLMVICLITVAAEARTLRVSPSGDDAATGEVEAPLKTIRRALSLAQPGDDVLIAAGVYREGELDLPRSGEPDRPITIQAEPDAEVVLKGSRLAIDWIAHGKGVWKIDDWAVNSQQLFVDGEPLQQIGTGSPLHTHMIAADMGRGKQNACTGAGKGARKMPALNSGFADPVAMCGRVGTNRGCLQCWITLRFERPTRRASRSVRSLSVWAIARRRSAA